MIPRGSRGRVPAVRDISSYVWALWWVAHQAVHLANPWFTGSMAAPAGIQLGYDTTMPLLGVLLAPVTLTAGPAAAFWLITIVPISHLLWSRWTGIT